MLFIHTAYSKAVFANYADYDDYIIHYFMLKSGKTKNKWYITAKSSPLSVGKKYSPLTSQWQ